MMVLPRSNENSIITNEKYDPGYYGIIAVHNLVRSYTSIKGRSRFNFLCFVPINMVMNIISGFFHNFLMFLIFLPKSNVICNWCTFSCFCFCEFVYYSINVIPAF